MPMPTDWPKAILMAQHALHEATKAAVVGNDLSAYLYCRDATKALLVVTDAYAAECAAQETPDAIEL